MTPLLVHLSELYNMEGLGVRLRLSALPDLAPLHD